MSEYVSGPHELEEAMETGNLNRVTGATGMNAGVHAGCAPSSAVIYTDMQCKAHTLLQCGHTCALQCDHVCIPYMCIPYVYIPIQPRISSSVTTHLQHSYIWWFATVLQYTTCIYAAVIYTDMHIQCTLQFNYIYTAVQPCMHSLEYNIYTVYTQRNYTYTSQC